MHVLIVEAGLSGHHSGYLDRITTSYLEAGHTVSVTVLNDSAKHAVIERLSNNYGAEFNVVPIDDVRYQAALCSPMGMPGRDVALRRLFGHMYRLVHQDKPVDYVFLPYLDYCLYALGLLGSPFGSTQWGGICMRPAFHYRDFGVIAPTPKLVRVKRALFLKLLRSRTLKSVYTIDELLHRFVVEQHPQWAHRLQYVPDPAELNGSHTHQSARRELGIPEEAVVILVYGAINERKGLDVLVEAMSTADVSKMFYLLVVGQHSDSMKVLMNSKGITELTNNKRCCVINSFVDDEMQQMVFAGSDVVWLGYRDHYSMSGVLVLAGLAGKPVVASNKGLLGWYTANNKLGSIFTTHNVEEVTSALQEIIPEENRLVAAANSHNLFHANTWKNLFGTIEAN